MHYLWDGLKPTTRSADTGAPARTRWLAKEGAPKLDETFGGKAPANINTIPPKPTSPSRIQTRNQITRILRSRKPERKRKNRREIRSEVERSRWRTWGASRGWAGSSSAPSGKRRPLLFDWISLLLSMIF